MSLSEHQREALARMAVWGTPTPDIARALGVTRQTIKRYLVEDEDIQARIQDCEGRLLRVLANHHFEMLDMLEDARGAVRQAIGQGDPKLRAETARWLIERVAPRTPQADLTVHLQGEVQANHEVSSVLQGIMEQMAAIQAKSPAGRYLQSVHTGPDALPGAGTPSTPGTQQSNGHGPSTQEPEPEPVSNYDPILPPES